MGVFWDHGHFSVYFTYIYIYIYPNQNGVTYNFTKSHYDLTISTVKIHLVLFSMDWFMGRKTPYFMGKLMVSGEDFPWKANPMDDDKLVKYTL